MLMESESGSQFTKGLGTKTPFSVQSLYLFTPSMYI